MFRRTTALVALLALSSGCAMAYKSFYKDTSRDEDPAPVRPKQVNVVKSRDSLTSQWTEIGLYRGKAPTVKEAMATAKQECGRHGANLYILNVEPFHSDGGWNIDGICARK